MQMRKLRLQHHPPLDRIIKVKSAARMLGVSVPTLYRWEQEGKLPIKKVRIGPHAVGFRLSDLQKWISGEFENTIN